MSCTEPYAYVREYIESEPMAFNTWVTHAKALATEQAGCNDAIALLLLEAADNGNADALRYMAELADPLVEHDDRIMFTEPDPLNALRYYSNAAAAGDTEADAARTRLLNHLRQQAAQGDTQARTVLETLGIE
ncbi:hypothetical protein F1188_18425 [Roseospira marina]|uniref:Sel1 repeat family protein n=1 Tax=Roseospira marina TaxID=140057 RepID=A0A5M6I6M7_9PROT|nr:hypothetical protein F1188_18425 [Roseospira marina]